MAAQNNGFLLENEKTANRVVAQVMRTTWLVFILIYILDIVGIFRVPMGVMTPSFIVGSVLLLLPTIITNVLKKKMDM